MQKNFFPNFLNPTGLGLDNFSTAQDLAKLAEYLLKEHRSILDITAMQEFDLYTADGKNLNKITNTNELLKESSDFEKRIIGGKTGETRTAGECLLLVLKAKNDKDYLINVILNSKDRFGETKKIINWLDSAPEPRPVFDPDSLNWEQTLSSAPWQERDSDAVLVYKDKISAFISGVDILKEQYKDKGLFFNCTGPWPPYNFCDLPKEKAQYG